MNIDHPNSYRINIVNPTNHSFLQLYMYIHFALELPKTFKFLGSLIGTIDNSLIFN
jgi:hypothetical protein